MAAPLMALPPLAALAALPSAFEDEPAALWPALAADAQGQAADAMARLTEMLVRQGCEKGLAGTLQALTALEALVQAGRSDLAARLLPLLHAPADSPPLSRLQAWLRGTEEGLARHAALFLAEAGSLSAQALPHLLALLQAGPDRSRYRARPGPARPRQGKSLSRDRHRLRDGGGPGRAGTPAPRRPPTRHRAGLGAQ